MLNGAHRQMASIRHDIEAKTHHSDTFTNWKHQKLLTLSPPRWSFPFSQRLRQIAAQNPKPPRASPGRFQTCKARARRTSSCCSWPSARVASSEEVSRTQSCSGRVHGRRQGLVRTRLGARKPSRACCRLRQPDGHTGPALIGLWSFGRSGQWVLSKVVGEGVGVQVLRAPRRQGKKTGYASSKGPFSRPQPALRRSLQLSNARQRISQSWADFWHHFSGIVFFVYLCRHLGKDAPAGGVEIAI